MRITLAASLAQAVEDVKVFHTTNINVPSFMEWVDKYQVCRISLYCNMLSSKWCLLGSIGGVVGSDLLVQHGGASIANY